MCTFTFVTSYFEKACKFCRAKRSNEPNNIGDEATKTAVSSNVRNNLTRRTYSYFEKGCRKKRTKAHATRPKGGLGIHSNFAYWPGGNLQVCIFARGKFVFPLRGLHL